MKLVLIACAGLCAGSAALAQEAITTRHLAALDANGDGGVDSAEFGDFMAKAFDSIDANADGFVTAAESQGYMAPEQFQATNINDDDGISEDEFSAQAQKDFTAADLDGDGVLN
jgi:hypothetical protein